MDNDPEFDLIIYRAFKGPGQVRWFLKSAPQGQQPALIAYDHSQPAGGQLINAWLEGVENTAKAQLQERGKTK